MKILNWNFSYMPWPVVYIKLLFTYYIIVFSMCLLLHVAIWLNQKYILLYLVIVYHLITVYEAFHMCACVFQYLSSPRNWKLPEKRACVHLLLSGRSFCSIWHIVGFQVFDESVCTVATWIITFSMASRNH